MTPVSAEGRRPWYVTVSHQSTNKPFVVRRELSQSLGGQRRVPRKWLVVDDGSPRPRVECETELAILKHLRCEAFCRPKSYGTSWGSTSLVVRQLAQLAEHLPFKESVAGPNPALQLEIVNQSKSLLLPGRESALNPWPSGNRGWPSSQGKVSPYGSTAALGPRTQCEGKPVE